MGRRWRPGPDLAMGLVLGLAALLLRLPLLSPYPPGWDAIDFALALERYDLAAMQPHFPGYPVFIWLGRLLHRAVPDPFLALAAVSALGGAVAVALFYLLAVALLPRLVLPGLPAGWQGLPPAWREMLARTRGVELAVAEVQARPAALTAAAWLLLSPLAWLAGAQPMSDSLGLGCLLAALLAAWHWWVSPRPAPALAAGAGALLGLTLGVRLSYFPFGLTLAALAWLRTARHRPARVEWPALGAGGLLGVAPWLLWQVAEEGGTRLLGLALHFTAGHLSDWGNAIGAPLAPAGRFSRFLLTNWLGHGLGGPVGSSPPWRILPLVAVVLGLVGWLWPRPRDAAPGAVGDGETPAGPAPAWRFLAAWLVPYFLWAYLGQNPYNPRHVLPLVPWLILLVTGGWLRWARAAAAPVPAGVLSVAGAPVAGQALLLDGDGAGTARRAPAARQAAALAGAGLLIATLAAISLPLAATQHASPPPAVALARYLRARVPPAGTVIYTWEEERTIRYYAPEFRVTRLRRLDHFLDHLLSQPDRPERILVTSSVLDGFGPAGAAVRPFFRPVARFTADPAVQFTYADITLYAAGPELYEFARRR